MIPINELNRTPEYWMSRIQNDLFRALHEYKESKGLNQTDLAKELGFTKGYISQVLNGNFNFSLKKLIDLSLAIGVAPVIEFQQLDKFTENEETRLKKLKDNE